MSALLDCRGCGSTPIDVGNMGRHLFACPLYVAHSSETTADCDCWLARPMHHFIEDAEACWNRAQSNDRPTELLGGKPMEK